MFFGEYRHQIDEKCRIRIPAKLREQLGVRPFIMKGPNNCLIVLKEEDANVMLARQFEGIEMVDPKLNFSLRMLTSSAFFAEEDKQGRIIIPAKLLEHIKLKDKNGEVVSRNVVTIGAFNRVEIWGEEAWDEYSDIDSEEFDLRLSETLKAGKTSSADKEL